jgi:hypothetical protein
VLIIGGRYGSKFIGKETSITNEEYREAARNKIPVFALVEQTVYADLSVYLSNRSNQNVDGGAIIYPAADSVKILDFIEEVRQSAVNNALVPFRDFADIESYLRQQWAGMMFSFLLARNEENRVADIMSQFVKMNERLEFLSRQILKSVGSKEDELLVKLYDLMLDSKAIKSLIDTEHKPHPVAVLNSPTMVDCAKNLGKPLEIIEGQNFITSGSGEIDKDHLAICEVDYGELRERMLKIATEYGVDPGQLITGDKHQAV